jgi:hypothetical protein
MFMRRMALLVPAMALVALTATGAELLQEGAFIPASMGESGRSFATHGATRVAVIADRVEYLADDLNAQFLVSFLGVVKPEGDETQRIQLRLTDATGRELAGKTVWPVKSPKLPVIVPVSELKPGKYTLAATLQDKDANTLKEAAASFTLSSRVEPRVAFPKEGVAINVHAQGHVPDGVWPISTGAPMAPGAMRDVSGLVLLENGRPVPAQFTTRGTWGPKGYVKWVGVDFLARYDKGTPRQYRLAQGAPVTPPRPVRVEETPEAITVDTGALKFTVSRKFAGIEQAWLDRNGDGTYGGEELVVSGKGGAFIVDNQGVRYDAAMNRDAVVAVEEAGPMRVTISAKGSYADAQGKELCLFVVRISAYAGQPFVQVSHRMVNTIPDTFDATRIADCGFEVAPNGAVKQWRFGFDGAERAGAGGSVYLHQDRDDHLRVMRGEETLAEGRRSDGWCTAQTAQGAVSFILRDMWQKFPKEFEFDLAGDGRGRMTTHFWPKHGRKAFAEAEELERNQIYKVRWAHQGKTLELRIPPNYHAALAEIHKTAPWAHDGEFIVVNAKGETKMQAADGQGTVIGNDLYLWFHGGAPAAQEMKALAALVQQAPHALSDPAWNAATRVYGPIAPRDPVKYPEFERLLDTAYVFYRRAILDGGGDYGMWIFGAVHGDWQPAAGGPSLRRTWQMCHYQNIFQAWLLYLRSGTPDAWEWARIHSNQHLDVGVCNYRKYPPGKHSYSHIGEMGGDMYHCKGFMPWAGNSSTQGHWIDIANYFARYYLTGDRRGPDMAAHWMNSISKMGFPAANNVPATADGIQSYAKLVEAEKFLKANPGLKPAEYPQWIREERAKPGNFNPREVLVPLGEMTQYYQATWDPQALLYLGNLAEYLNLPFKDTQSPGLADFGKHWHEWYYAFARDPRVVRRIAEYMAEGSTPDGPAMSQSFAAFLYHATGETKYLKPAVEFTCETAMNIYSCPGDRYDGYSIASSNPGAMVLGRMPYLMHAAAAAGVPCAPQQGETTLPTRGGRVDYADKWIVPPRGWTNAGVTILGVAPKPATVGVRVTGPRSYGSFRGHYQLYYGFPELNVFAKPGVTPATAAKEQEKDWIKFPGKNSFNDPPTQRNFGANDPRPYIERADNDKARDLYHLEMSGDNVDLPVLIDADTKAPFPQVAVIPRTMYWNAQTREVGWSLHGFMNMLFRPLDDQAAVTLTVKGVMNRYGMATAVKIADAAGRTVADTSVLPTGQRKEVEVKLDPAVNPLPWRITMASAGDVRVSFTGAEELFFAAEQRDFEAVLPKISVYRKP